MIGTDSSGGSFANEAQTLPGPPGSDVNGWPQPEGPEAREYRPQPQAPQPSPIGRALSNFCFCCPGIHLSVGLLLKLTSAAYYAPILTLIIAVLIFGMDLLGLLLGFVSYFFACNPFDSHVWIRSSLGILGIVVIFVINIVVLSVGIGETFAKVEELQDLIGGRYLPGKWELTGGDRAHVPPLRWEFSDDGSMYSTVAYGVHVTQEEELTWELQERDDGEWLVQSVVAVLEGDADRRGKEVEWKVKEFYEDTLRLEVGDGRELIFTRTE